MKNLVEKIKKAAEFIKQKTSLKPDTGILLGTGLGKLAEQIKADITIPYDIIPGFPRSTVEGHDGRLIIGRLEDTMVIAFQGRFHYYEGHDSFKVTMPVRLMKEMDVKRLFIASAAGGLEPDMRPSELMFINDHINLMGINPLIGQNHDEWGPRFPEMAEAYSRDLINIAHKIALENKIKVHEGTYVAVSGPSMETKAETRFLKMIGAKAVGMSTVPEVITAVHSGIKVFATAVITNVNLPDNYKEAPIELILKNAEKGADDLSKIIKGVIKRI